MLGEGKPENQNHAIIFTRGEGLQTIDMNQVCRIVLYAVIFSKGGAALMLPFKLIFTCAHL